MVEYVSVFYNCVKCEGTCKTCYNIKTNCSVCFTSGGKKSYLLIENITYSTGTCYKNCPDGYLANTTTNLCDSCF